MNDTINANLLLHFNEPGSSQVLKSFSEYTLAIMTAEIPCHAIAKDTVLLLNLDKPGRAFIVHEVVVDLTEGQTTINLTPTYAFLADIKKEEGKLLSPSKAWVEKFCDKCEENGWDFSWEP